MRKCIVCGCDLPAEPFLSLPNMPACAQNIPSESELAADKGLDLNLYQCSCCGLVQLDCEPVQYYRDVIRAGGGTKTMTELRQSQYRHFIELCGLEGKRILEVGCGQGEFLEMLKPFPMKGCGIENKKELVDLAVVKGLSVTQDFASDAQHKIQGAPFDAFMQFNFIEHQPHPNEMVQCIRENLVDGGVGLVTAPAFEYIRNDCVYEIMRDHLAYYTDGALRFLFMRNGFDVLESGVVNRDTNYVIVKKREVLTRNTFKSNFSEIQSGLNEFVVRCKEQGHTLAFWAASHQCFTAASFLDHPEGVAYIVDSAKFKQGRYSPTSHIKIISPDEFYLRPTDDILVLAPGYTEEIANLIRTHIAAPIRVYALRSNKIEIL